MSETLMSPEIQEMFLEAVREVVGLYLGDQIARLLGSQSPEMRDQFWMETAQKFSPFSEIITRLRQVLKDADVTKGAYPEELTGVMQLYFCNVKNPAARALLADLLFARTSVSPGYIDYSMEIGKEAEAMASELGSGEGLKGEDMESVTLERVVEAVLSGRLKLTRQTQLEKK